MSKITEGSTVTANEQHRVPSPGNESGMGIPAFDDNFQQIGFVQEKFPLLCIHDVGTIFIKVLGPIGPVCVMKRHLKHF